MTIDALAGAGAGTDSTGDADAPGNGPTDTYETSRTFESLGVSLELTKALADEGIVSAFPIQALTVSDALAGRDVCGKAKTGSGKTLAFGVPLLQRAKATRDTHGSRAATRPARPLALVLLPTRELAVQVHDVLAPLAQKLGLRAVAVYGGADIDRQVAKLRKGTDIVIATPGRLIDLGDRGEVAVDGLETLVLDEADRMADMGFMPQVEWVLRRLDQDHQTLLFSATLDGAVDRLVKRYLSDPVFHEVASATQTVTLMEHRFLQVHQMDKVKVAAAICRGQEKSLLFVRTKRGADRLVENLTKEGVRAAAIHGDLRQANRERALSDFSNGKLPVLVATDVAARGLHIEGVDAVIHYDPPEDHKAYLHRSGRTARRGQGRRRREPGAVEPAGGDGSHSTTPGFADPDRRDVLERSSSGRSRGVGAPRRRERPLSEASPLALWSPDDGVARVLVVTAHPDDVDFGSAGTVAAFTAAGVAVTYCVVTNGDAGGSDRSIPRAEMAALRQDEQRAAAAMVGVDDVRFLGHPDGMVQATMELRRDISRVIRQVRPERVVTQSPERNWDFMYASHPDHLAAGEAAVSAVYPDRAQSVRPPRAARGRGARALDGARPVDHGSGRGRSRDRRGHDGDAATQDLGADVPQEPDL